MKRDAYHALGGGIAIALASASPAQPTPQTPPTPVQPSAPSGAGSSAQGNDQSPKPPVPPQKTCEPVEIRAGPNQGQIINKCHHSDRSKTAGQSTG